MRRQKISLFEIGTLDAVGQVFLSLFERPVRDEKEAVIVPRSESGVAFRDVRNNRTTRAADVAYEVDVVGMRAASSHPKNVQAKLVGELPDDQIPM